MNQTFQRAEACTRPKELHNYKRVIQMSLDGEIVSVNFSCGCCARNRL